MDLKNIDQSNITFHLGLEKTGSTFYQKNIFKNLLNIQYHRKSRFKYYPTIVKKAPDSKHLFTFETDRELAIQVDKIAEHLPEANVFIILRRQDSWLASKYHYHIRKHGSLSARQFFDLENDTGFWKKEEFFLKPKIDLVRSRLQGNILFLNFSELKTDPPSFVNRMISFIGVELNPRADIYRPRKKAFSLKQNKILLQFNRFYPYKKAQTRSKFLNKVHYKYREFLLHTIAFLAQFVPHTWVSKEPLISKEYLEEVKAYYKEDWEYVLSAVNKY